MKPDIARTTLKITAGSVTQFPRDNEPQIALVGRSNVGKSSLLNAVIGRKSLARVSSVPGKTVTVNFYEVDGCFYLVDLPGYGFAKGAREDKRRWSALTDAYFTAGGARIAAVIQLVDLKVGITADDEMMLDFLNSSGIRHFIVATKADKLSRTQAEAATERICSAPCAAGCAGIVQFSALKKQGVDAVIRLLFEALGK